MVGDNADETLEEGLLANQEDEIGYGTLTDRADPQSADDAARRP